MSRRAPIVVLSALLVFGHVAPAAAWVRSRTTGCHPVIWTSSCIYIQPDGDLTADLAPAEVKRLIQSSMAAWQTRTTGSYLKLIYVEPAGPREARFDHQPTIKFRTGRWCRPGDCVEDKETCYDSSAAAITTVFFVNKPDNANEDGQILDADVEMNSVNNLFYDADQAPPRGDGRNLADLENTLVHELGHLQGLEHTCRASNNDGTPDCTVDDQGARPPLCSFVIANAPRDPKYQQMLDTTMFATAQPRETKKRTPEADDIAAIDGIYPTAKDPKKCDRPASKDQCGGTSPSGCKSCAVSARAEPGPAPLLLLGLIGLLIGIRRRLAR